MPSTALKNPNTATPTRKPRASSGWTPERRAAQAEAMRRWKPWEKSTGPKTPGGKARSSRNAINHDPSFLLDRVLLQYLREQRRFLARVNELIRLEKMLDKAGIPHDRATLWPLLKNKKIRLNELLKPATHRHCEERSDAAIQTISPKTTMAWIAASALPPRNDRFSKTSPTQLLQFPLARIINPFMNWTVAALYRFVAITDLPALQAELQAACDENGISGTLLIAPEGINGTIAGQGSKMEAMIDVLDRTVGVRSGELKYSHSTGNPFRRTKVRIKKEIITMAAPEADPTKQVGTYVTPADWNNLISDPDVTVIDTRNDYETKIGIFKGAIDPDIEKFTDFKDYVAEKLDPAKHKKIAMFCTGGIRCEKASSYMLAHGFEEVYHLQGGILKYLETIPADQSLWEGECFVFDRRVAVGHGLEEGNHDICYGCRLPLSQDDMQHAAYEKGVSCPHCRDALNEDKIRMLRLRHKQFCQQARSENSAH